MITWPEKYGGRDASLLQWVVFEEEYFRAGAPGRASANGIFLLAPTLFEHGTDEQLDRVLPKMASGEEIWAQAWSEPESGSDLASLRSTARRDETDGGWLLNGQKIWSSRAPFAHWAFGLFRSDPEAERHHGLTYFMFALDADGVTVRPIAQLDGDTGLRRDLLRRRLRARPRRDRRARRRLAGRDEHGEQRARDVAAQPRPVLRRRRPAGRALEVARRRDDPGRRPRGRRVDQGAGLPALHLRHGDPARRRRRAGRRVSVTKVFWSELDVALHQTALDLRGPEAEVESRWIDGCSFALSGPIYAGTNEIQRNIIAERMLGLPREPKGAAR